MKQLLFYAQSLHEEAELLYVEPSKIRQVLIFLHGKESSFDCDGWREIVTGMHLEEVAERYQLLIVIPHVRSEYYISHDDYDVDTFIACELKDYIRQHFRLDEGIRFSLGGVSMGGYGAVLIGAHHPDYFEQILSVSGSFIQKDVVIGNPEVWGSVSDPRNAEDFLRVMVPVWEYEDSVLKNPTAALVEKIQELKSQKVIVALACGTEDWLYPRNQMMQAILEEQGIASMELQSVPGGDHEASCFAEGLEMLLKKIYT